MNDNLKFMKEKINQINAGITFLIVASFIEFIILLIILNK